MKSKPCNRRSSNDGRISDNLCAKIAHNWQFVLMIGVLLHAIDVCNGHGRLIEPPSRSSAFRYGFQTPPNYNDHELYCGGFARQQRNGGKCGECGDPWGKQMIMFPNCVLFLTWQIFFFTFFSRCAATKTKWTWWQIWTRSYCEEV